MFFLRLFQDFLSLFYPELCTGCGTDLVANERIICTSCIYHLPVTGFHSDPVNRFARQFWGRFPFVQAVSYVYFRKGGRVQKIMHQLKYNNRPEAGFRMGELYGSLLKASTGWKMPDIILPVPLHPARLRKRGYNQSEHFANGLASALGISVSTTNLIRRTNTETQTSKSRFARYENLLDSFKCLEPGDLGGKHVLIADDVATTGATLEACCSVILAIPQTIVSVATIAYAE